ncbi:tomoregulin-2-like isoform X1 [Acipenser oxyrinchus oxyrinchus]|uniref:Tomoregulin-2-like isoform X1 n=1 Tax=Acipenser oxyrinchus oxyrinchus TaxID=40147 RepID=A0AAD8DBW9_ACIOX|nr:tomoregulin-2-like isoform X1 [Acipenser oxyrinchus oxyrinchus]
MSLSFILGRGCWFEMRFSKSAAAVPEPYHGRQRSRTLSEWVLIAMVTFVVTLPVQQLRAFPTSLSDCQTPTGWNCSGFDERDNDLFLCDTNTCKFDGECLQIGETVTCVCEFKCNNDYVPVCGSNKENYQNECLLRKDGCKRQTEVLVVSEGACPVGTYCILGDCTNEGSGETSQKETSTCDICQFGAECDEDAEDVWCVCNIDCSHISFNPVCASDGKSYDNPCQVKEASCQRQERIEMKYLGRCQDNITTEDGHYARTDTTDESWIKEEKVAKETARGLYIPCPERYSDYCINGKCEYPGDLLQPSCRCDAGFSGAHCDKKDFNVLYVVPGAGKLRYVLIASIIGAVQVAIICVVVLCITRWGCRHHSPPVKPTSCTANKKMPKKQQDKPTETKRDALQFGQYEASFDPVDLGPCDRARRVNSTYPVPPHHGLL